MNKGLNLLFCFITIISSCAIGQQETGKIKSNRFFELAPALDYINLSNPRHSIVRYSGLAYSFNFGLQFEKPTKREGIYLNYLKGGLTSQNGLNTTGVFNIALGYFLERRIKQLSETTNWYLGGDFSTFLNMRQNFSLGNNQMFYDFVQDLRISTSIRKELEWKNRPLYVDYRLKLPLIALISRPPKAVFVKDSEKEDVMPTSDQLTKNMFTNGNISLAGKYSTIQSTIVLWCPFKKNMNRIGLSYIWDLYAYRDYYNKKQVMATHSIKFILLTNL